MAINLNLIDFCGKTTSMSTVAKPYLFSDAPKLTRAEAQLANSLFAYLGMSPFKAQIKDDVFGVLKELTRAKGSYALDNVEFISPNTYEKLLQNGCCIAAMAMPPKAGFFFVDLDTSLAKELVYRVLGKDSLPVSVGQTLSEVEQGIFSFVLLKILDTLQHAVDGDQIGQFQLLELGSNFETIASYCSKDDALALLNFKFKLEDQESYFRIVISPELIHSLSSSLQKNNEGAGAISQLGLRRSGALQIPIVVELGHVSLQPADVDALEVDDIIVLEGSDVHLKEPGLVGNVRCQIGSEEYGSFKGGLLLTKNGRYAVSVSDIVAASEPAAQATLNLKS
jgi:flagellar motor switch protein FliM